jgi:NAD(P)-dependent dehydrogenase (short-subunit alcohol dehydrogenase family)
MDDYARVMAINLRSQVVLTNLALPHLAGARGSAVLMSSLSGLRGNGAINAYALAKAGWRNWRAIWRWNGAPEACGQCHLARIYRHRTVRALAGERGVYGAAHGMTPLRRPGRPEVAGAAVFLASAAGGFVTTIWWWMAGP